MEGLNLWELLAVLLGIAYLLLAVRESLWCWYAAFAGTSIYLVLFWEARLLMESALQVYYLAMAVYGWWQWRGDRAVEQELVISRRPWTFHASAITAIIVLAAISGYALARWTDAALPFVDSLTTWGAVLTTWMVARKILENWLYWVVIDAVSILLYLDRELYLTAGLFAAYTLIAIKGYLQWRSHYRTINS